MQLALVSLLATGCRETQKEAQAPETNPWADYKGTYAQDVPTSAKQATPARSLAPTSVSPSDDDARAAPTTTKKSAKKRAAGPKRTPRKVGAPAGN